MDNFESSHEKLKIDEDVENLNRPTNIFKIPNISGTLSL